MFVHEGAHGLWGGQKLVEGSTAEVGLDPSWSELGKDCAYISQWASLTTNLIKSSCSVGKDGAHYTGELHRDSSGASLL